MADHGGVSVEKPTSIGRKEGRRPRGRRPSLCLVCLTSPTVQPVFVHACMRTPIAQPERGYIPSEAEPAVGVARRREVGDPFAPAVLARFPSDVRTCD